MLNAKHIPLFCNRSQSNGILYLLGLPVYARVYSLLYYLVKGTRGLFLEAISYMRLSNFYGDDGSYLPPLPNSSEGLGTAGGREGRFLRRQLSGRCVITTLAAAWADAWSCQAPTEAIQVAGNLYFPGLQTFLVIQWAPGLRQWGWDPEDSHGRSLAHKGAVCWS